jgi:hypothetical protein
MCMCVWVGAVGWAKVSFFNTRLPVNSTATKCNFSHLPVLCNSKIVQ